MPADGLGHLSGRTDESAGTAQPDDHSDRTYQQYKEPDGSDIRCVWSWDADQALFAARGAVCWLTLIIPRLSCVCWRICRMTKPHQAYRQAEDIHAITASQVFHVPLEEVTPQLRRNAKAVNFGIVYGISAFWADLGISRKEATEYIERYFETYPDVKRFLDGLVKTGRKYGEVKTMYGRVRPIPELKSGNFMQRSFGERVAMNSPIQGTAADIIKIAMIVDQRLRRERTAFPHCPPSAR